MKKHNCSTCGFRARFDRQPTSLLGRMWRWHANWCPGWSRYMKSLAGEERQRLARHYKMEKFL
ncbi:MAG: hypothetical protein V6Z89_06670 [Desulfobacter sp.]